MERIAQNSRGDVRSAINDLQSLSEENHTLTLQDTVMLSSRNKDISMDETLRGFFSAQSIAEVSSLLSYSNVDYDDFLLSVSDNLPRRYTDPDGACRSLRFCFPSRHFPRQNRHRKLASSQVLLQRAYPKQPQLIPNPTNPSSSFRRPIRIITCSGLKAKEPCWMAYAAKSVPNATFPTQSQNTILFPSLR